MKAELPKVHMAAHLGSLTAAQWQLFEFLSVVLPDGHGVVATEMVLDWCYPLVRREKIKFHMDRLATAGLIGVDHATRAKGRFVTLKGRAAAVSEHFSPLIKRIAARRSARVRSCLRCREHFWSVGPEERVCSDCKKSSAWKTGPDLTMALL